jgi:ribose 5-phosphate isomerase A
MPKDLEKEKELAAKEAVKFITNDLVVGLGTGSTAFYVLKEVARLVNEGLRIKAVPTSNKTAEIAGKFNIPLLDINSIDHIDITIDGADEFNRDLVLIKGGGGALLKEKIVASMTRQEIIIADSSKQVLKLGKFPLPVEVIPFASSYVKRELALLGGLGNTRMKNDTLFLTDQGNYIIDIHFGPIEDPVDLADKLNRMEGIVCHGLFIGLANTLIMGVAETGTTITYSK